MGSGAGANVFMRFAVSIVLYSHIQYCIPFAECSIGECSIAERSICLVGIMHCTVHLNYGS